LRVEWGYRTEQVESVDIGCVGKLPPMAMSNLPTLAACTT